MSRRCEAFEPWLSAWVDGELGRGGRARVGAHLQRCPKCRAEVTSLRVTQTLLRAMPTRTMPVTTLKEVVERPRRPTGRRTLVWATARATIAAAAVTVMVGAAGFIAGSEPPKLARTSVPVEIYVADHMVRAIGGAVSTPALVDPKPGP